MITQELRLLRFAMNQARLSRKEAAALLHLSCSALKRKLRGEAPLRPEELKALQKALSQERMKG